MPPSPSGITLVFGIMGILNFAHGQMVMLGAYIAFFAVTAGFGFWVGLLLAMAAMGLFGLVLERLIFRHTLTDHMTGLTVSLGIIMVVENLAAAVFTPDHRNFDPPLSGSFQVLGITLSAQRLLVLVLVMGLVGAFYLFLQKTSFGKAIRATGPEPHRCRAGRGPDHADHRAGLRPRQCDGGCRRRALWQPVRHHALHGLRSTDEGLHPHGARGSRKRARRGARRLPARFGRELRLALLLGRLSTTATASF